MFKEILKKNRPQLSDKSINAYNSTLTNLYKSIFNDDKYNINNFKNKSSIVIKYLNKLTPINKKNKLSPLVVLLPDTPIYKEELLNTINIVKGEPSPIKEQNIIDKDKLNNIIDRLKKKSSELFKKDNLTMEEQQQLQDYIIISLYTMTQPRRLMDYTEMKIKNINKDIDNYINNNNFIFNSYKQSSIKGQQETKIPKLLLTLLNKWINKNPNEYLLYDTNNNKLTSVTLNNRLNKIFDDKISVNSLRHTYLTNNYKDTIDQYNKLSDDMKIMGSSVKQSLYYILK